MFLINNIRKIFKLAWIIDKKGLVLSLFCSLMLVILPVLSSYYLGQSFNLIVNYLAGNGTDLREVYLIFVLSLCLSWILNVFVYLKEFVGRMHWLHWHKYSSLEIPKKIASLDIYKLEDPKFANLINRVEEGASFRPANFINSVIATLTELISVLVSILIVANFNIILLLIIFLSQIPGLIILMKSGKQMWGIWDAKGDISRMASLNSYYLKDDNYIREIRIFNSLNYIFEKLKTLFDDFQYEVYKVENKFLIKNLIADVFEILIYVSIQLWLLSKVLQPNIGFGIGDFTFIKNTIDRFTDSNRNFLKNLASVYENNLYVSDFLNLLSTENKIISKPGAVKIKSSKAPSIEFKNVTFMYPGTQRKIFENLNIKINSGEDIALVGENGAGKTTFVKLLLRFYDVTEGEILIDGVNIKEIDLDSYYNNIGVLFQRFNTYYYTVKENIFIGRFDSVFDMQKIIKASKLAGAYDFIEKYNKKFDQLLNKQFDDGIEPSIGQWQRIALARNFYRDANILILDEPTSAIDPKGEFEIFKTLNKLQKEKTTIIISHRFSTVRNADKIYVLENGKIIEQGTHEELMNISFGKYRRMFELQAEGYR